jgi:hypothetical protein
MVRFDPRDGAPHEVVIDMRYCDFVRPPAALWCLVFAFLVRRSDSRCVVLVPENIGVARYLQTIGLFELLKQAGTEIDDRGVAPTDPRQIGIQLQRFRTEHDVDNIANAAIDHLNAQDLGAPNLRPLVAEAFAELGANAVQHSGSPIDSYGMIQYYEWESGARFVCVVADGGIGIRQSLERNPQLQDRVYYDWDAIELAMQERISGTGIPTRGIGLYAIAEDMRRPGHQLLIHSGIGLVRQSEELEADARRTTLFPGTLVYATMPA